MKILVYQSGHPERFAEELEALGMTNVVCARNEEEVAPHLADTEVILAWGFPVHLLSQMPKLRWVQWTAAGVDRLVAKGAGFPSSVTLTRIVDLFSGPISEYIFGWLLYVVRDMQRNRTAQANHAWDPFRANLLSGNKVGVAGLGSIGKEVVRKARAFDMEVVGLSATGTHSDLVDKHYGASEWAEFVADVDVLVLTLPLTDDTYHVVGDALLRNMKKEAVLVNIGRGKLIDEPALVQCLRDGHLKAAILDVFEQEPLPEDSPLWDLPNVYISPHMSGPSLRSEICAYFADNLKRLLAGDPLVGVVDFDRQY